MLASDSLATIWIPRNRHASSAQNHTSCQFTVAYQPKKHHASRLSPSFVCYLASTISAMDKRTWDEAFWSVPHFPRLYCNSLSCPNLLHPILHPNVQPLGHWPTVVQLQHAPATILLAQPISAIHSGKSNPPSGAAFSGMSQGSSHT